MTREEICAYIRANPGLDICDVLKWVYQSRFGCIHLVGDSGEALAQILREAENASLDTLPTVEDLPGKYCRLHLKVLSEGLSHGTLCKLFVLSAAPVENPGEAIQPTLDALRCLSGRDMPFATETLQAELQQWENRGYPPCNHSSGFKAKYHPAYRVIKKEYARLLPLFLRIDALLKAGPATVAVDGRCASGKTTLAHTLQAVYGCNVFHMDDFFLMPSRRTEARLSLPGGNVDWERFKAEVLLPLSRGEAVLYRRYDCQSQRLLPPVEIPRAELNLVEGSYSHHKELRDFYQLTVALDVTPEEQAARIQRRNSPEAAKRFHDLWIPLEERYFSAMHIYEEADTVLRTE